MWCVMGLLSDMLVHCSVLAVQHSSDICMARVVRWTAEDLSEMEERVLL